MSVFEATVTEVRYHEMIYRVEADNRREALEALAAGRTIAEDDLHSASIADRIPHVDTVKVVE